MYSRSLRTVLALAGIFLVTSVFAQGPAGYVVRNSGDTTRGSFPAYRASEFNPALVTFVPASGGERELLAPQGIRGFAIDGGEEFRSFNGQRMTNPVTLTASNPGDNMTGHYAPLVTFLRVFARNGNRTFYAFVDELRTNLYYAVGNEEPVELRQQVFTTTESAAGESGTFRMQLQQLFQKDPGTIVFSEEAVSHWINRRQGADPKYRNARSADDGLVLMAGVSNNKIQTADTRGAENNYSSNVAPYFAVGYVLRINKRIQRFFLMPQAAWSSYSARASKGSGTGETLNQYARGKATSLGLYLGYRFTSTQRLRIFGSIGLNAMIFSDHKLDQFYTYDASYTFVHRTPDYFEFVKSAVMARGMIGTEVKRIWIWAAYQGRTSLSDYSAISATLSGLQAGVGYRF